MDKPKIFSIPLQNAKEHFRSQYLSKNFLQKEYNKDSIVVEMDDYYLALRRELNQLLIQKKIISAPIYLEQLHEYIDDDLKTYGNDGLGSVGTLLYDDNESFLKVLRHFIHNVLYKKVFRKPFYFQATPTFRVHCPYARNSEFFPHYHTDIAVGHPPKEINLWIPLTPPLNGHGFYLASLADSKGIAEYVDYDLFGLMDDRVFRERKFLDFCEGKFLPVNVNAGKALIFDGRCFHTAMAVHSHTRISIDFRIILEEDFDRAEYTYQNCGRRKHLLMVPHDYYFGKNSAEV